MNSDIVEKIQKLLRLSTDNPSVEEAASAFAKAQALATAAGLDLAVLSLQGQEQPREEIDEKFVECGQRFPVEYKFVTNIINKFLNVRVLSHGGRFGGRKISFIGPKTDTSFAIWLYDYLIGEFYRLWEVYRRNNPRVETKQKNSFYFGINNALLNKIEAAKREASDKCAPVAQFDAETIRERFALMVVHRDEEIAQFVGGKYPKLKHGPAIKISVNQETIAAGYKAGQTISLNRPITD